MKTVLEEILQKNNKDFNEVVHFNAVTDTIAHINLSKSNTQLTEEIYSNTTNFSSYINTVRNEKKATFLIGGYAELRTIYQRSLLFDEEKKYGITPIIAEEPRRLHLGIDIWGDAGTPVFTPLGGVVHSFAFNNNFGDYGATIILQHQLQTVVFHTLYGHLSLVDIANLHPGKYIGRGELLAHFGTPKDNGNWPPHLHFQVIADMNLKEGDYPGVCKLSEQEKYLTNCPNPNLILNLLQYAQ
jgi:peptidoglycan LD-endopeptidase LytH